MPVGFHFGRAATELIAALAVRVGAGGGTRTDSQDFFEIQYSATTPQPPETYKLITVERA